MADVKSVIKGTVNTVGAKAKNYVESGALKEAYLRGTTAARCYADIAKLNLQINGELEAQKDIFIEIGRAFYDENRGAAFGKYAALFDELEASDRRIDEMREALEAAKAAVAAGKKKKEE